MSITRVLGSVALLAIAAGQAMAQSGSVDHDRSWKDFDHRFPDGKLVYDGIALLDRGDFSWAFGAWEQYSKAAPAGADTAALRAMIEEAVAREYPQVLWYQGVGLLAKKDTLGAVAAWEAFLDLARAEDDTVGVGAVLQEVRAGGFPRSLLFRAFTLFGAHDYQRAVALWDRYLWVDPDADGALVYALIALAHKAESDQALASK